MKNNIHDEIIVELEKELRHVCTMIRQKGREILTDFEITPPQFTALQHLIHEENLTIGELSNRMFLACSTITDLVDRMEKNQLVRRKRDEKDRRVVRIEVLPKGHEIINEVLDVRRSYLANLLIELSQEDKNFILRGIEMIYGRTL